LDPREYLVDNEEGARLAQEGHQSRIWTAMPCIVNSVNLSKMTLEATPAIQGRFEDQTGQVNYVNMPQLLDVPICFPSGGGFLITYPIAAGDEVLVVFASRCIDSWWQNGGFSNIPMEFRMHDLSDGFAIPGPRSQPNVASSISSTDLQIRSFDGTAYLSITPAGLFGFQNETISLKQTLTDLQTALVTFMTTLAAFSGGGAPVTQAMLQAPAATAETALIQVLVEIGELLK
jgi:protein gp138